MNGDEGPRDGEVLTILLYASDRTTRQNVRLALGRKVAPRPAAGTRTRGGNPGRCASPRWTLAASTWRSWMARRCPVGWGCAANSRTRFCAVRRSWC